jgi:superfamily II DNA helicase RecQ
VSLGEKWGKAYRKLLAACACAFIAVDESHPLFSPSDFRAGMGRVRERIRPVVADVTPPAIIMLTATAPPNAVAAIATVCGASQEGH